MNISLEDLGLAYRKAKVDIYYSTNASLLQIADYEEDIERNLNRLLAQIVGSDESWIYDRNFLGTWVPFPKSITVGVASSSDGLVIAAPDREWRNFTQNQHLKPIAEFRLMARCSMDFHVLSTLWMMKIGERYEKTLSKSAYGSRLRRKESGEVNMLSLGSFAPYLKPFRDWRDGGIKAMRTALDSGKSIVALTADVSSFYHELNPGFMLNDIFLKLIDLNLDEDERKLNQLFIEAVSAWAKSTPLGKGLPVGLPASAVIANMALIELDRLIEQQVAPIYYGRYVDDILLVVENGVGIDSVGALWEWLFDHSDLKLGWANEKEPKGGVRFRPSYLHDSDICFANDKNKVFLLSGMAGKSLVNAISEQIQERASEWRSLPNLPDTPEHVATELVSATNNDGERADNLRKTDSLTMHRASFALKLRDYEAYERDLSPDAWKDHRHAFLDAIIEHLLAPRKYFELAQYLPRIIRLATACEDFSHLKIILEKLWGLFLIIDRDCEINLKALPNQSPPADLIRLWSNDLARSIYENIAASFPARLSAAGRKRWEDCWQSVNPPWLDWSNPSEMLIWLPEGVKAAQERLFSHDLAHLPLRFVGFPKELISQRGIPRKTQLSTIGAPDDLLPQSVMTGLNTLASWLRFKNGLPFGLVFATRPFSLTELYLIKRDLFEESSQRELRAVVLAIRGFSLSDSIPKWGKGGVLHIKGRDEAKQQTIAVSSWKTEPDSWVASVTRRPDPDQRSRYWRLNQLIAGVISQPDSTSYLILPELSLPARWFMRIAQKLKARGISLIAGVEYLHSEKGRVSNQVWAALTHDSLGFPALAIYRQDKLRPALHEEQKLFKLDGLELKPEKGRKDGRPPVIEHGPFRFALMICSELTNIRYRAELRGRVDAIFVPEWNQDTESFNALVESAALDVHAYIIQCNDRQYGDSRIRAPHKDSWMRDVLKVKGGIHDYCVTGRIDVLALRQFQSCHRSPDGPFKPMPDGFECEYHRRVLPAAD